MTQPQIDTNNEELRKKILTEFKQVLKLAPADYTENCTNVVMSLITSRDQQIALAARIDELEEARKWSTKADSVDQVWQQLTDRIARLKAAQGKL